MLIIVISNNIFTFYLFIVWPNSFILTFGSYPIFECCNKWMRHQSHNDRILCSFQTWLGVSSIFDYCIIMSSIRVLFLFRYGKRMFFSLYIMLKSFAMYYSKIYNQIFPHFLTKYATPHLQ